MPEVSRRLTIEVTLAVLLKLCTERTLFAQNEPRHTKREQISWNSFLEALERAANLQLRSDWNQENHVRQVGALASALDLADRQVANYLRSYRDTVPNRPEFKQLLRKSTFEVSLFSFEKGETIPYHDHPAMTGVTLCTFGHLEVDRLEELPAAREQADRVLLKRTGTSILKPGSVSVLTAKRSNVHQIRATRFSQVIDIFTPPYDEKRIRQTKWFELDKTSFPGPSNLVTARKIRQ